MSQSILKQDEIYITLYIKKHNTQSNIEYLYKYTNGFNFESIYKYVSGKDFLLDYENGINGLNKFYKDLPELSETSGRAIGFVKDKDNDTTINYSDPEFLGYGLNINYSHIIPQSRFNELVFDPEILNDPSLVSFICVPRIESIGGNATTNKIEDFFKENPNAIRLQKNIRWMEVLPPFGHPLRKKYHDFPDEVYLNAPYYKTQKLPSGCILLQMTEKTDFTKFDQEYWDKMIELYEYFVKIQNN